MTEAFLPDAPLYTPSAVGWHRQPQAQMFAKGDDGDDPDDDDDDDDDPDDDDDDDDPDEGKSEEELRAELRTIRQSMAKYKKGSSRQYKLRKEAEGKLAQIDASKSKPKPKSDDGDDIDLDAEREAARKTGLAEGEAKAKRADLKAVLIAKGVDPANARLLIGQVKLDDLEYDEDDELDADDTIDDLKLKYPQLFGSKGAKRRVSGDARSDATPKKMSATERQARALLGK